jgi:hypothetical protein
MKVIETENPTEITNPLFTAEHFKSPYMTIITHEGYFISESDSFFSPSYNTNIFNESE